MFDKLVSLYSHFAVGGLYGDKLLDEILRLSEDLGILDTKLEKAILAGYSTGGMVEIELAKELFHSRIKRLPKEMLQGTDPYSIFSEKGFDRQKTLTQPTTTDIK